MNICSGRAGGGGRTAAAWAVRHQPFAECSIVAPGLINILALQSTSRLPEHSRTEALLRKSTLPRCFPSWSSAAALRYRVAAPSHLSKRKGRSRQPAPAVALAGSPALLRGPISVKTCRIYCLVRPVNPALLAAAPPPLCPSRLLQGPAMRCRSALLLCLLRLGLAAALPADPAAQQDLTSTQLGEGASAAVAAAAAATAVDFCAGADEAAELQGWTSFPSAPGIPGHFLDAMLLRALASAAQRTAWQPCSRGGMMVSLEGCQRALPGGGANYQLRAALSCNSHHLNVASLTADVHWPAGSGPQVTVLEASAEYEPMPEEQGQAADEEEELEWEQQALQQAQHTQQARQAEHMPQTAR
ncbi:hypothetical protein ABPG75_004397 [Micractinium tetrahymenae]